MAILLFSLGEVTRIKILMIFSKKGTSSLEIGVCLFDLDGTLASTSRDLFAALNKMLRNRGMTEVSEHDSSAAISRGGRAMIAEGFGIDFAEEGEDTELDALFEEFITIYEQNLCVHSYLFGGVKEQLARLRKQEVPLGVVTNKREVPARRLLEALGVMDYFTVLVGGNTLTERKPHPLPMQHAVEALGGTLATSVMIGDSRTDVEGARNAGIASIVVSFGYSDVAVKSLGADLVLDDFGALPEALDRLKVCQGKCGKKDKI